jgi:tetratricopeptide (TPR) repeat protein
MLQGWGHLYQADLDVAHECARKSISLTSELSPAGHFAPSHILSGLVSAERGELPQARHSLEEAMKLASNHNEKHMEGQARMYLGWVLALEDPAKIGAAEQTIMEGLKMVEDLQIKPLQALGHFCLGEAYAIAGQREKALARLQKAQAMCREMGMDYHLVRTEKALEKLQA